MMPPPEILIAILVVGLSVAGLIGVLVEIGYKETGRDKCWPPRGE